jgi:hypothetical protein
MVKSTTFEILGNFKAVMEELTEVFTSRKVYKYERNYKGKRFPYFVYESDTPYSRTRTSKRYMTGRYYSDTESTYGIYGKNKMSDIMNYVFKKSFRCRKQTEKQSGVQTTWAETENEYKMYMIKTIYQKVKEETPDTIQHYKDSLLERYNDPNETGMYLRKLYPTLDDYYKSERFNEYSSYGFIPFITSAVGLPNKKINPYFTKYNVGRIDTKVCDPKFYSRLFTGENNFSLMKIKYAKGGKISNAGLTATTFYYYNGDRSNWEFNSHSKVYHLEHMCSLNDIKIPKGCKKYEDLAKLLKEKMP